MTSTIARNISLPISHLMCALSFPLLSSSSSSPLLLSFPLPSSPLTSSGFTSSPSLSYPSSLLSSPWSPLPLSMPRLLSALRCLSSLLKAPVGHKLVPACLHLRTSKGTSIPKSQMNKNAQGYRFVRDRVLQKKSPLPQSSKLIRRWDPSIARLR